MLSSETVKSAGGRQPEVVSASRALQASREAAAKREADKRAEDDR